MNKTRAELLDLFVRQVTDWLARFPAEAGTIRTRVCAALKFNDLEFANWIRASKDQKAIAALEGAISKTVIQPKIAIFSPSSDDPPPGLMDGVDSIFENEENSNLEEENKEASPSFGSQVQHQDADERADWLDSQFPMILRAVERKTGSRRVAGVAYLFRQLARNLGGRDAATEALVREQVCKAIDELKKADYERCMREARAKLKAEKNEQSESAAADGDQSDWGGLALRYFQGLGADRALLFWRESWYVWTRESGFFNVRENPKWIRMVATTWMMSQGLPVGAQQVTNLIGALEAVAYVDDDIVPPCWLRNIDGTVRRERGLYISMANGILDLESVRFEMGDAVVHAPMIEHTPDFFTLNNLPYAFDPQAACPQLEAALEMWQPREADPEGLGQRVLQEFAGYTLEPGQPHQVMLMNYGPGSDGKSQFKDILIALVGKRNTVALGLEVLDPKSQLERSELMGKMLWTIPDANQLDKIGEGTLKAITGGDAISISRKFKNAITGPIDAKVIMNCNELPGFRDRSEGVWRRLLVLHWQPVTGAIIPDFAKKLIAEEMPGIFMWALRGWRRVREAGFARRGVLIDNVQSFRRETQHEFAFFDECVEVETGEIDPATAGVSLDGLMAEYKSWCAGHNITAYAHPATMGRALSKWVRWQLLRMPEPWADDKISEFLNDKNFKRKRSEPGKRRTDYYVRIRLLQDDEAEVVEREGGWVPGRRMKRAPPRTLYE